MSRARLLALAGAFVAAGCGSSSTAPTTPPPTTPPPAYGPTIAPVVLDAGNFATLVLGSPNPCLVEFQRPT